MRIGGCNAAHLAGAPPKPQLRPYAEPALALTTPALPQKTAIHEQEQSVSSIYIYVALWWHSDLLKTQHASGPVPYVRAI